MKKKIVILLCLLICIVGGIYYFGMEPNIKDKETLTASTEEYLANWNATDFLSVISEYEQYIDENSKEMYTSWDALQKEVGEYVSILDRSYAKENGAVEVILKVKYANRILNFTVTFDESGEITATTVDYFISLKEKLQKAGLNTAMGIGIVFIVLIFISFIIYLLKFVPALVQKLTKKEKKEVDSSIEEVVRTTETSQELVDDLELVAVITAAIMASKGNEGAEDGFVVKSIRRRKSNKWQNA